MYITDDDSSDVKESKGEAERKSHPANLPWLSYLGKFDNWRAVIRTREVKPLY